MAKRNDLDITNIQRNGVFIFAFCLFLFSLFAAPPAQADCTAPAAPAGTILYNTDVHMPQYCDGTDWIATVPVPGAGGAGCVDPSAPEGVLLYNEDHRVPQYCDGANWIAVGRLTSTGWTQISGAHAHTCGVREDGTAWCWGSGDSGKLGNGDTAQQNIPVRVGTIGTGTLWSDWAQISAGGHATAGIGYTCGVRQDGSAWCWGGGAHGKIGNDTTGTDYTVPQRVGTAGTGTLWTDWVQVETAIYHTCGLRSDGTAWCWGSSGDQGRLGDNDSAVHTATTPVQVQQSGGGAGWTDWVDISVGGFYNGFTGSSCGVRNDGSAWCWGHGTNGRLGTGSTSSEYTPARVGTAGTSTLWSDWIQISAGAAHSCGVRSNGTAWCWGLGDDGRLGDDNTAGHESTTPVQVQQNGGGGSWSDWVYVRVGNRHTCGLRSDSTAWCWGRGANGQRGDGTTGATQGTPVQVGTAGTGTLWSDWTQIADDLGDNSADSCGIRSNGTAWCWGSAANGKLGNGDDVNDQTTPVEVAATGLSSNPSLVAYWPLNESGGTTANDMAGDHIGYVSSSGGVVFDSAGGRIGGAVQFSSAGSSEGNFIEVPDSPAFTGTTFTVSAWVYATHWNTADQQNIVSQYDQSSPADGQPDIKRKWVMKVETDGKQSVHITDSQCDTFGGNTATTADTIPLDQWLHFVGVWTPSAVTLYRNGVQVAQDTTGTSRCNDVPAALRIGERQKQGDPSDLKIDDVRYYDRELSGAEIDAIYQAGQLGLAAQDCTSPNGVEGTLLYNSSSTVMQYCDGASWIGIGK